VFSCETLRDALSDLLDGEVDERVRHDVEHHLADCSACRVLYDSARKTLTIVSDSGVYPLPQDVAERLLEGVLGAVRAAREGQ
jgi:predicted anti-sigma-YlaC factor YlaD